jgi:hypothetical protein
MTAENLTVVRIEHVRVWTAVPFADVTQRLEAETGLFDRAEVQRQLAAGARPESVIDALDAMAGRSGFMRFFEADHGTILRLYGQSAQAVRYLIGHPLFAARMTRHVIGSALYAPLSLLVVAGPTGTWLEYDRPSSLFAQFHAADVANVALELDRKLDALIQSITWRS